MPFDPAPRVEVSPFQQYADAMLRGCSLSPVQCRGQFFDEGASCALGAMALGLGFQRERDDETGRDPEYDVEDFLPDGVCHAYRIRYGVTIPEDNDKNGFTREEIAARIAAL